jgi:hypothetical protein
MVIGKSKDQGSENAGIEDIISTDFIVARHDLQQFKTVRAQEDDLSSPCAKCVPNAVNIF